VADDLVRYIDGMGSPATIYLSVTLACSDYENTMGSFEHLFHTRKIDLSIAYHKRRRGIYVHDPTRSVLYTRLDG
jgi:hypothetical protein